MSEPGIQSFEGNIDVNDRNTVEAVADLATRAANPLAVDPEKGRLQVVVGPDGGVHVIDVEKLTDQYRTDHPVRKTGTFQVHDPASFVAYLEKHALPQTEVWANLDNRSVVGVINAHAGAAQDAGFADHRVTYAIKATPEWKAWTELDGNYIGQVAFAEHIEDRLTDIIRPDAADMMELAQTLHVNAGVTFTSSQRLSNGEREFTYREEVNGTAGRNGRLEIPEEFYIGVAPFEGADPVEVKVRFRYKMREGKLEVGYKIADRDLLIRSAFEDVVMHIGSQIDSPIYMGTSA